MKTLAITINSQAFSKLIYLSFILICFLFFVSQAAFAQDSTSSAQVKKLNLTFPIAELGNCSSLENCKQFCSDPTNEEACTTFAKQKGFYKVNTQGNVRARALIEKAKLELGCTSEEQCRAFCSEEANKEKCIAFAQKYGLTSLKENSEKNILEKAKELLGCTSQQTCKTICQQVENRQKCSDFAKAAGIRGGLIEASGSSKIKERLKELDEKVRKNRESSEAAKEKFTPSSEKAFENANEKAKFCRENPQKCNESTKSAELKKKEAELKREMEKKELELRKEKEKKEMELKKKQFEKELETEEIEIEIEDNVQGVSSSPSVFEQILRFFFK